MALLSATQGTPERVYSLVTVLLAHGGSMSRDELLGWLNPRYRISGQECRDENSAAEQTIQAASGLKLIDATDRNVICSQLKDVPNSFSAFSDLIHTTLAVLPDAEADAVLFQAFSWLAVRVEIERSTLWVSDWTTRNFADKVNEALTPDDAAATERRFNPTKIAPWRRWTGFLGLSSTLPTNAEYPCIAPRLRRELSGLPSGVEIDAGDLLNHIAQRMPYLDGGRLFKDVCGRLEFRMPPRSISRLLSAGLRDLHNDGFLKLVLTGDAGDIYQLTPNRFSKEQSFGAIILKSESVNGSH